MEKIKPMLVVQMQASALLGAVKTYDNGAKEEVTSLTANLNTTAKDVLAEHTVKCYVPADKIGFAREIDATTATDILANTLHIDQNYFLNYLRGSPLNKLENMMIMVEILPYKNQDMIEALLEAMFLNTLRFRSSNSGKMDWNCFEEKLHSALPAGCSVSDFVGGKKYFLPSLLSINPRLLSASQGANHEA